MEFSDYLNLGLAIFAIIAATSWGVLFRKGRNVWKNLQELSEQYSAAVEDGNISDEERAQIADTVIEIIIDTSTIWQAVSNMVRKIIPVLRRPG